MRALSLLTVLLVMVAGCSSPAEVTSSTTTAPPTTTAPLNTTTSEPVTTTSEPPVEAPGWEPGRTMRYEHRYTSTESFEARSAETGELLFEEAQDDSDSDAFSLFVVATDLAPHGEGAIVLLDGDTQHPYAMPAHNLSLLPVTSLPVCNDCSNPVTDFRMGADDGDWWNNELARLPMQPGDSWTGTVHIGRTGSDVDGDQPVTSVVLQPIEIDTVQGERNAYPVRHTANIDTTALVEGLREDIGEGLVSISLNITFVSTTYYVPDLLAVAYGEFDFHYALYVQLSDPFMGELDIWLNEDLHGILDLDDLVASSDIPAYTALEALTLLREPLTPPTIDATHVNAVDAPVVTASGTPAALFPDSEVRLRVVGGTSQQKAIVPAKLTITPTDSGLMEVEAALYTFPTDPQPARTESVFLRVDYIDDVDAACPQNIPGITSDPCDEAAVPVGDGTAMLRITATVEGDVPTEGVLHVVGPDEEYDVDSASGEAVFEMELPDDGEWTMSFTPEMSITETTVTYSIEALGMDP